MATTYTVKKGDTLPGIAFEAGFYSWETIYNHPQNESLRAKRPNPGELYVGDQIYIPDKEIKTVELTAFGPDDDPGQKYTFKRKSLKAYISLYLEDEEDEPYNSKNYKLDVDGEIYQGKTGPDGLIFQAVSPKARRCVITLWPNEADATEQVTWTFDLGAAEAG